MHWQQWEHKLLRPLRMVEVLAVVWLLASVHEARADEVPGPPEQATATEAPAPAAEEFGSGDTGIREDAPLLSTSTTGFLDSRTTAAGVDVHRLVPANDTPQLHNLTEANLQLRLNWGEGLRALGDVSLIWQRGGYFRGEDAQGDEVKVADHDVPSLRPATVVSELYLSGRPHENLELVLGKKRVVWGAGMAANPTDLLNPPKDPTDPTLQRAGSWLALAQTPFERWTVSVAAAGKVTRQFGGVPAGLVWYPDAPLAGETRDEAGHWALAARAYALVAETDLQVFYFRTNLYNDSFQDKDRFGLSLSRVFWDALELHVEALVQTGAGRLYPRADCVTDLSAAAGCMSSGKAPLQASKLDDGELRTKTLLGARWMFGEASTLSLEYLYNGEGYDDSEFGNFAKLASLRQQAQAMGISVPAGALGLQGPSDPGSPQKFAFEPLRRHYAFLSYLQSQIRDDWTVQAVLLLGLEDLSGQLAPQVTWSVREWLNLTAAAFVTIPGLESRGVEAGGEHWTEFGLQPTTWRAYVAARVFY